jgi:hypothetical protein
MVINYTSFKVVIAVETVKFTALFLTREDKADVFVLVFLKKINQFKEVHFVGNALNGAGIEHIG